MLKQKGIACYFHNINYICKIMNNYFDYNNSLIFSIYYE